MKTIKIKLTKFFIYICVIYIYTYSLAQVKAGNTSENLLKEIKEMIYSLYREKEVTKKVYKI